MKRFLQLLTCVFLSVFFCGCTSNNTISYSNVTNPKETETISENKAETTATSEMSTLEIRINKSDEQSAQTQLEVFALSPEDFEIIYQNEQPANIETIKGGDFINDNKVLYYSYRFDVNDETKRGIKSGNILQDVSDAYLNAPIIIGHGSQRLLQYDSVKELMDSEDLKYAYAFTIFVYSIDEKLYSYSEGIAMLESQGLSSDDINPMLNLAKITDANSVISYEMTFYLSNTDGEFDSQTPIKFINIRKGVYSK